MNYDAEEDSPAADHDIYSLSGGALLSFADGYSAGLSLTRAQRAPSIEELYNDGPHLATGTFERGNPALDPETANNLDLTLRKKEGRWTWRLTAFVDLIEEFIFADPIDEDGDGLADRVDEEGALIAGGELLRLNFVQDDALFYGAEFESILQLIKNPAFCDLDARLFTDYVRGKLIDGENCHASPAALRWGARLSPRSLARRLRDHAGGRPERQRPA